MKPQYLLSNYMSKDLIVIEEQTGFSDFAKLFDSRAIHHLLVENSKGELSGIISKEDMQWIKPGLSDEKITAKMIMTPDPKVVLENQDIKDVIQIFLGNRIRALPVTDDKNKLVGIITPFDFLLAHLKLLDN